MTLPTLKKGSYVWSQYGSGDFHDASRHSALHPTVLDFDNFSGDSAVYDDIRRLAAWPNATRVTFVASLVRYARTYGNTVFVTVPFTKWLVCPNNQCNCYANNALNLAGAGDIYFSAFACGLVNSTKTLWDEGGDVSPFNNGINTSFLGTQAQGSDDTAVLVFAALLDRSFSSRTEYENAVATLPPRIYAAAGPRATFVTVVAESTEFSTLVCPPSLGALPAAVCTVNKVALALLLRNASVDEINSFAPSLANGSLSIKNLADTIAIEADKDGLYSQIN